MQMESLDMIPNEYEVGERMTTVMKNAQEEVQRQTNGALKTEVQEHIDEIARESNNDNHSVFSIAHTISQIWLDCNQNQPSDHVKMEGRHGMNRRW